MNKIMKKMVLHSGGMNSLSVMLDYIENYGASNILSLGFNYGQRNFNMENMAAQRLCYKYNIERIVLDVPLGQIGGSSLTNYSIDINNKNSNDQNTAVPMRNGIFLMLAASVAQVNNCDTIAVGSCIEDKENYRDGRSVFFRAMELAIQCGLTRPIRGKEYVFIDDFYRMTYDEDERQNLDIVIDTPLINETKVQTLKRIIKRYSIDVYNESYTCYLGDTLSCGECLACQKRLKAFKTIGEIDPLSYKTNKE